MPSSNETREGRSDLDANMGQGLMRNARINRRLMYLFTHPLLTLLSSVAEVQGRSVSLVVEYVFKGENVVN